MMPETETVTFTHICGICNDKVGEETDALCCDLCLVWFHSACMKYNKTTFKSISSCKECKWFCKSCGPKSADSLKVVTSILTRMDAVEAKNASLEKRIVVLEAEKRKQDGSDASALLDWVRTKIDSEFPGLSTC